MENSAYESTYTIQKNRVDAPVDPRSRSHWKRNKKPEVDLLHGAPFVLDRQLEDQRFQLEFNRNPRAYENTKVEKTRSEKLIQKQGNAAPINTKVKALNKIVREASGVYNYTLVPPPRRKDDPAIPEVYDADTHPLTKPYRDASKLNPSLCSFGHRPSSASRTFHPATMNFRLKKGEIVRPGSNGKTGFGLTPANLAKIITAPKYVSLEESLELDKTKNMGSAFGSISGADDPFGLFTAPTEDPVTLSERVCARDGSRITSQTPEGKGTQERHIDRDGGSFNGSKSLGSQSRSTARNLKKLRSESNLINGNKNNNRALSPLAHEIDRPSWDDWHHRVDLEKRLREKFKLRGSALDRAEVPLSERLTRFAKLTTVDVKEPKMYCKEKWDLDTAIYNGAITHSELGGRGSSNYLYDPDKEKEFIKIKKMRKKYDRELQKKHDYANFVNELDAIPDVPYQPSVLVSSIESALNTSYLMKNNGLNEVPTQATLSATHSCATVESVAKQIIKAPELVLDRGPFFDLSRPKSPWGRGPTDNFSVPRSKEQAQLLPSEKLAQFLPQNSNVPVAKDFVFAKNKGTKKVGDFPLDNRDTAASTIEKSKKKVKSFNKKGQSGDPEDDYDLLHADTTPALSEEMNAMAANLLSGEIVVDNTRRIPDSIPVIYCGSDWEKYYKNKKKVSARNAEVEIFKAAVPSVSEYIDSLRNRSDFEFENKHTYKKKGENAERVDTARSHGQTGKAGVKKSAFDQGATESCLTPLGDAGGAENNSDAAHPELNRRQYIENDQAAPDDNLEDLVSDDVYERSIDDDRGSTPTRHQDDAEDGEEKYDSTIRYGD